MAKVSYQQAVKNLNAGGLKGKELSDAQAVLQRAYSTPEPVTSKPTTTYTTPSKTPYVSDSSSVITREKNTESDLERLMGRTSTIDNTVNKYVADADSILGGYMNTLQQRLSQQTDQINREFDIVKQDTETAQNKEKGSTNVAVTRLGGYLGGSGSAAGVIQNLSVTHRAELNKLASQRAAAISAASSAINDKQFQVALKMVETAKEAEKEIYGRQQDFFNNALKLQGEFRAEQDQVSQNAKELLDKWQYLDSPDSISRTDKSYVDAIYGPGFTDQYLSSVQEAKKAEAKKDSVAAMQAYINLLQSVPSGVQIPIGDEIVTGIGKTSDLETFKVEDKDGNVRLINYNKGNGQYSISNFGAIGTATGGGSGGGGTAAERAANALAQYQATFIPGAKLKDGTTVISREGYITPQAWKQAIADAPANGLSRAAFIEQFGYLLQAGDDGVSSAYGLTPVERKLITGEKLE